MMKKLFLIIFFILFFSVNVYAEETSDYYDNARDVLQYSGIDFSQIQDDPIETLYDVVLQAVKSGIKKPFKVFYKIAAVLILSSFINFFVSPSSQGTLKTVNILCSLVIFCNIFGDFISSAADISDSLVNIKDFMVAFIPIFSAISFASGEVVTSTVYTGFFLLSVTMAADFCIKYILPSVNLYLALGITSSVSDVINLKAVCEMYSKIVKLLMTATVSVLCFVLSVQTTITQGQDTLAVKTGKLLVTSAVPIIGSSLQGAVSSLYASMGILKSFFGIAGIAVILNMFLPHIIYLAVNWIGYFFMMALANILENKTAAELMAYFKNVIEILLSMSVLFLILLVFSLTVMIKTFGGT